MYEFQLSGKLPYAIELMTFSPNQKKSVSVKFPAFVFVSTNDLFINLAGEKREKCIKKGQLFLLPRAVMCQFKTTDYNEIIIMQVPNITALYVFFISEDMPFKDSNLKLFYPLTMEHSIVRIMESLQLNIQEGFTDPVLIGLKTLELFHNLKHYYSKQYLDYFFSSIYSKDCSFAIFILSNYGKIKTAEELAELSNYSISGFNKQFNKVFGISPYKWMLQQKIDKVYHEIYYETSKPIKVIAEEYGFNSLSNLGDFCRKYIGTAPTTIRNRKK